MPENSQACRGRIAPSPTGLLHLGHARTFWTAAARVQAAAGTLVFRNEDIDPFRCKPGFAAAAIEDLAWLGIRWQEGPDVGGRFAPYDQSARRGLYESAFERLRAAGAVYPCTCSRKDVEQAAAAPHETGDEPVYAGTCRPGRLSAAENTRRARLPRAGVAWRFAVPDGQPIRFEDGAAGPKTVVCGEGIGDFVVWRKDDWPGYQLAVVVDDAAMQITEVVRGEDLLVSTFRQLLLYGALDLALPRFFHCPLVTDAAGVRLAKRHAALSLRALREQGWKPDALRACWHAPLPTTPP